MDKILAQNCVLYNGHNKDMKMESVLNRDKKGWTSTI